MPSAPHGGLGRRIAYYRSVARLTQQRLADAASIHIGTLQKIERGARGASDSIVESIAAALGVDPSLLMADRAQAGSRIHAAIPAMSAAIAAYDVPDDGPVRPVPQLRDAVTEAVTWRVGAQYVQIVRRMPDLLSELFRALQIAPSEQHAEIARLTASALRSADAVAYKFGAYDLSARLIDLMRWAAQQANDPILSAACAYVRTETFFAADAHGQGLRALVAAIDQAAPPADVTATAALGALHMREAVIAGRGGDVDAADLHLAEARRLGDQVPEAVYAGTAFGPHSVRIHEVSVAVSLGSEHVNRALEIAREWAPPGELPAERRSGFYIELARAQL
ncbi:helix-turn-helix domain-containing protein [Nonomuraea terrae]|uniref:helix-turn-helix domain-containing protein n=1 Tax=Nonomuraea terrae TaxID=2530383 RepID=UPI0037B95EB7